MVESDYTLSTLTALLVISTVAVAFATFRVWRATQKVADATNATQQTMKEVGSYSIMPHFSINVHGIKTEETTYRQFDFRIDNDGIGDAFYIRMQIMSDSISTTLPLPFDLPRNHQTHVYHNVKRENKKIKFTIIFDDIAGNAHERIIDIILNDPLDNNRQQPQSAPSDVQF